MINPWARFIFWMIVTIVVLLVLSIGTAANAQPLKIDDGMVTMHEEDFNKMIEYERYIEGRLREDAATIHRYQQLYNTARRCVMQAAMHNTSALKCFYPDSENI